MSAGHRWHCFISHTSADDEVAGRWFDVLNAFGPVYLDYRCSPGVSHDGRWREVVPRAQWESAVTIVLLSEQSLAAQYQAAEIAAAIALARAGRHRVVVVDLEEAALRGLPGSMSDADDLPATAEDAADTVKRWIEARRPDLAANPDRSPLARALRAIDQEAHWEPGDADGIRLRVHNRLRRAGWTEPQLDLLGIGELRGRFRLANTPGPAGQEIRTLAGHEYGVNACLPLADGRVLAGGAWELSLWDAEGGRRVRRRQLRGPDSRGDERWDHVRTLVSLGDRVAVASRRRVIDILTLPDLSRVATFEGHEGQIWDCSASAGGDLLATVADDGTVRIWDPIRYECLHVIPVAERRTFGSPEERSCALKPDGSAVAVARGDGVVVYTLPNEDEHVRLTTPRRVTCVRYSPNGATLATTDEGGGVRLWRSDDGALISAFEGHDSMAWTCAFSHDGTRLVSGGHDHSVRQWCCDTGRKLGQYDGHSDAVWSVAFAPDEARIVSGSGDGTVRLWHADDRSLPPSRRHGRRVLASGVLAGGAAVLVHNAPGPLDTGLDLSDPVSGASIMRLDGLPDFATGAAISRDGRILAAAALGGCLVFWDLTTGAELRRFPSGPEASDRLRFDGDGRLLLDSSEEAAHFRIHDPARPDELACGYVEGRRLGAAVLVDGGSHILYCGSDSTVRVHSVHWEALVDELEGHTDSIYDCAVSPDGAMAATASYDGTVRLWGLTGRRSLIAVLEGHTAAVNACAFAPDGLHLASAGDDCTLRVWEAASGRCVDVVQGNAPYVNVHFLLNVLVATDKTDAVWVFEASSGQ